MKVVHLTAPAPFGGLESVVAGLARETVKRGHSVTLVMSLGATSAVPAWALALQEQGVRVEALRLPGRAYLAERAAVREILRREAPDVVHTHGYRSDALHVGVTSALNLPIVSTAHGFASTGRLGRFYEWIQLRAWRGFDAVVAVSTPLLQVLVSRGIPRQKLHFIRNGFVASAALETRAEARARLGLPAQGTVLGWVGRLSAEKNPLLAVEGLAALAAPDVQLCLIGDGPLREGAEKRAIELGVRSQVVFAGAQLAAGRLLAAFDALVLSSRTEGTPMVLLEAAAAGVPIVATRVGGVPSLVGEEGALVPSENAAALADAIGMVLRDPLHARKKAEALWERLRNEESKNDWVGAYLGLYAELAAAKRS